MENKVDALGFRWQDFVTRSHELLSTYLLRILPSQVRLLLQNVKILEVIVSNNKNSTTKPKYEFV